MKLEEITLSNIKSFFQGQARAYLDKIDLFPLHKKEQVFYRIYLCRDSCVPFKYCTECRCPALKKSYATKSCNLEKFPDLMGEKEWTDYKLKKNINEKLLVQIMNEVDKIFKNK